MVRTSVPFTDRMALTVMDRSLTNPVAPPDFFIFDSEAAGAEVAPPIFGRPAGPKAKGGGGPPHPGSAGGCAARRRKRAGGRKQIGQRPAGDGGGEEQQKPPRAEPPRHRAGERQQPDRIE